MKLKIQDSYKILAENLTASQIFNLGGTDFDRSVEFSKIKNVILRAMYGHTYDGVKFLLILSALICRFILIGSKTCDDGSAEISIPNSCKYAAQT